MLYCEHSGVMFPSPILGTSEVAGVTASNASLVAVMFSGAGSTWLPCSHLNPDSIHRLI